MNELTIRHLVSITLRDDKIKGVVRNESLFTTIEDFEKGTDSKFFTANLDTEDWENVLVAFNEALEGKPLNESQIVARYFPVTFHFVISKIPKDAVLKSQVLCDLIYTTMRLVLYEYDPKKMTLLTEKQTVFFRLEYYYSAAILIKLLSNVKDGSISNKSAEKINEILLTCIDYESINRDTKTDEDKVSSLLARIVQQFIVLFSTTPGFEKKFESYQTDKKGISLLSLVEILIAATDPRRIETNRIVRDIIKGNSNKSILNRIKDILLLRDKEARNPQPHVVEDKSIAGYLLTGRPDVFLLLASWLEGLKK